MSPRRCLRTASVGTLLGAGGIDRLTAEMYRAEQTRKYDAIERADGSLKFLIRGAKPRQVFGHGLLAPVTDRDASLSKCHGFTSKQTAQ
jgi:hypothetical protein